MKSAVVVFGFVVFSSAIAQVQSVGTLGETRGEAARELVEVCESSPLVQVGKLKVVGVGNVRFTLNGDKEIYAWGDCQYEGEGAPRAQDNSAPQRDLSDFIDENISPSSGPHVIVE